MNPPDLKSLQQGDGAVWDEAFCWLWPTVFAVAQLKLQPYFPNEVEDVAIEALEEIVERVARDQVSGGIEAAGSDWTGATVQSFSQSTELAAWENSWPKDKQPTAKIIYDRAAGEVRVSGRWHRKPFQKTFLIERDLESTLQGAKVFIHRQTERSK